LDTSEAGGDSSSVIGGLRDAFAGFLNSLRRWQPRMMPKPDNSGLAGEAAVEGTEAPNLSICAGIVKVGLQTLQHPVIFPIRAVSFLAGGQYPGKYFLTHSGQMP